MAEISEKGPWRVIREGRHDVAIMSDDFTHDVILSISGDFANDAQRTAYAELLARRLNEGGRADESRSGSD